MDTVMFCHPSLHDMVKWWKRAYFWQKVYTRFWRFNFVRNKAANMYDQCLFMAQGYYKVWTDMTENKRKLYVESLPKMI